MVGSARLHPCILLSFVVIVFLSIPLILISQHGSSASHDNVDSPSISALRYKAVKNYVHKLEHEIANLEESVVNHPITRVFPSPPVKLTSFLDPMIPVEPIESIKSILAKTGEGDAAIKAAIDPDYAVWKASLATKLVCKARRNVMFYHYHTRKAAGTSIRDSMKLSARLSSLVYMETEGLVLNSSMLTIPSVLTVTSLREPISRILSLYWYEHVGWYASILKQPTRCKPFHDWVAAWRDGSTFKKEMQVKNPRNNYVEIENYYTKMLIGWEGKQPLTERDLERAKTVLRQFDLVLISEWMGDETQIDAFNAVFRGRQQVSVGHKVVGDKKMRDRLTSQLAPDEEAMRKLLAELNAWDLQLYSYAQSLAALRLKEVQSIVEEATPDHIHHSKCTTNASRVVMEYRKLFGVFQPAGHKGP
jgi:hypothetical protein